MVVIPDYRLEANGKDVTDIINKYLISMHYSDNEGLESDELTLTVSNIFDRPPLSDVISLNLGVKGSLNNYGAFMVHTTSVNHKDKTTEIKATAFDFADKMKEKKSRLWEFVTLEDIAKRIAAENGLQCISENAGEINIASKTQHNKSDIVFLRQLSNQYGFSCSVKDRTIYIKPISSKEQTNSIEINITDCISLRIEEAAKKKYGSVVVEWMDRDTGDTLKEIAGSGSPAHYIRDAHPKDTSEASLIAGAKLNELNKGTVKGNLTCIGGKYVRAGDVLSLSGIGKDSGDYKIESVSHSIDSSGYLIDIEFAGI